MASRVAYILEQAPELHGNYNAIIAMYWKVFDDVESIDDLVKPSTTLVTTIDRAVRNTLNKNKLRKILGGK